MKIFIFSSLAFRYIAFISFLFFQGIASHAQTIKYKYDALGRVTFVEDAVNGNRDYDFDKKGNRTLVTVGNGSDTVAEGKETDITLVVRPPVPTNATYSGPFSTYGGGYSLKWNVVTGATYYYVTFKDGSTTTYTKNYGDTAGTYPVLVYACNEILCSASAANFTASGQVSSASSSSTPAIPSVPANPTYTAVTGGGCSFKWDPVTYATFYYVTFKNATAGNYSAPSGSITGTYPVSVVACNGSGAWCSGAASFTQNGQACSETPNGAPAVPTNPTYSGPYSSNGDGYSFTWDAVTGATYYTVIFKDGSSKTYPKNSGSTAGTYPTYLYACNASACGNGTGFIKK